jgi:ubiquinone/menaquinone biosynthesis C-methylase UbiE
MSDRGQSMDQYIKDTIEFYDKNVEEFTRNSNVYKEVIWLGKFSRKIRKAGKVLDLGCAFGRDTEYFVQHGFDSYGADLSENLIREAKKRVPSAHFSVQNLLKLNYANGFFDGIWCSAVLVHIAKGDIPKALMEINRVLKIGGHLYLNLKEGEGEGYINDPRYQGAKKYYSYFKKDELYGYLAQSGFLVDEFKIKIGKKNTYNNMNVIYLIAKKQRDLQFTPWIWPTTQLLF